MNKYEVIPSLSGERLDKALSFFVKDQSRAHLILVISQGLVKVNGTIVTKPAFRLKEGDVLEVDTLPLEDYDLVPENIPLEIVYEDDDILIINKAPGIVVHPSNGHQSGTLVNALLFHCQDLSGINGVKRPGIVHRIDKDTSGLLVVCKNDFAHQEIAKQLVDKTMNREYYALVKGVITENCGKIDAPIGRDERHRQKMAVNQKNGKDAVTFFNVMTRFHDYTLVTCKLMTGRTHQIRVHLSYIGYPIEGDPLYGSRKHLLYDKGQLLHAYRLTLLHPRSQKEMTFEVPLPNYFAEVLQNLK